MYRDALAILTKNEDHIKQMIAKGVSVFGRLEDLIQARADLAAEVKRLEAG
jgi:hypothetical protein